MGATLPTLTRYLTQGAAGLAGAFQRLYTANTVGAILGAALAGFVLIEVLGLTGALLAGAVCSVTAGAVALLLDRRAGALSTPVPEPAPDAPTSRSSPRAPRPAARPKRGPRRQSPAPRADAGVHLRPDVAGLPGRLEPPAQPPAPAARRTSSRSSSSCSWSASPSAPRSSGPLRPRIRSMVALIGVGQILTAAFACFGAAVLARVAGHSVQWGRVRVPRVARRLRRSGGVRRPARHDRDGHHLPGHRRAARRRDRDRGLQCGGLAARREHHGGDRRRRSSSRSSSSR